VRQPNGSAYGDPGTKNGVHVGFADLRGQGIKGEVDPSNSRFRNCSRPRSRLVSPD